MSIFTVPVSDFNFKEFLQNKIISQLSFPLNHLKNSNYINKHSFNSPDKFLQLMNDSFLQLKNSNHFTIQNKRKYEQNTKKLELRSNSISTHTILS